MATIDGIKKAFATLVSAGLTTPAAWDMDGVLQNVYKTWEMLLFDMSDEKLLKATINYIRADQTKFWPTPGQLIASAPERQKMQLNTADEAWGLVCKQVASKGFYQLSNSKLISENFEENRLIWKAIEAVGGIERICRCTEDQEISMRAHFCSAYNAHKKRNDIEREESKINKMISQNFEIRRFLEKSRE